MLKKSFFGTDIYVFEVDEYYKHLEFVSLIFEEVPKWLKWRLEGANTLDFTKNYGLSMGLMKCGNEFKGLIFDHIVLLKDKNIYLIEAEVGICPSCQSRYRALQIRNYDLYAGVSKDAYEWAMAIPYVSQCLNCGYDWDEPGKRFLAIFQDGKEKYAV